MFSFSAVPKAIQESKIELEKSRTAATRYQRPRYVKVLHAALAIGQLTAINACFNCVCPILALAFKLISNCITCKMRLPNCKDFCQVENVLLVLGGETEM